MAKQDSGRHEIELLEGLEGQDDNLDTLFPLFEQLQLATVEAADPHLDLITFATSVYYFAVITEYYIPPSPKPEPEEDENEITLRRNKLSAKAAKKKNQMDQFFKSLAKQKSTVGVQPRFPPPLSYIPPGPSYSPVSTSAPKRSSESFVGFPKEEEIPQLREFTPPAAAVKNENNWWKLGDSEAIGDNLLFDYEKPVVDDKLLDKQEALWSELEINWETDPSSLAPPRPISPLLPVRRDKVIGMVYLASSQNFEDPLHVGELNIGIILAEQARGKGYARRVIEIVANKAFEDAKCHRLQAILLNHVAKDRALCLFTEMRFCHEGTRRRSFFSPMELEWKDVTYMAILDTDWIMDKSREVSSAVRSAPKSLWDELFARHQREREELLHWESTTTLRRTSSTATLRAASPIPTAPPITSESEVESEMSDSPSSPRLSYSRKGKRKADTIEDRVRHGSGEGYDGSTSDSEAELDPLNKKWKLSLPASESPNPFTDDGESDYESVTSWDALESSASSSDNMSDSGDSSMYDFIYDGL